MRAAEDAAAAIGDDELAALFAPLAGAKAIAIAVSGGADSLALLDCIDRWRRTVKPRPKVVVLTVDHGLRPEAAAETAEVARIARSRRLAARVLVAEGAAPTADIEAAARATRYRLLLQAARQAGARHLVTAHHRDDQAETFLMRLQRGSGLFGLAAMRGAVEAAGITVVRPFLDVPKARLRATVAALGWVPAEDPMNADPRFARARMRRALDLLAGEGIGAATIAATAARLESAASAIEELTTRALALSVSVDPYGIAWIDPERLAALPQAMRLRFIARLLVAVGGEAYPPRFERLSALEAALRGAASGFKRTLAGAVVERRGARLAVYRELGREGLPETSVSPGQSGIWDHRFAVAISGRSGARLTLGALGEADRRAIGAKVPGVPAQALAALPAIRAGGRLLAVPGLFYAAPGAKVAATAEPVIAARLAAPPSFPDFP